MVVAANTVAHPRTVMVHPLNTNPTYFTVMCSHRLNPVALEAVADLGQRLYLITKVIDSVQLDVGDFLLADGLLNLLFLLGPSANIVDVQEAVVLGQVATNYVLGGAPRRDHDRLVVADHQKHHQNQERWVQQPEGRGVLGSQIQYCLYEVGHKQQVV